jgi:hypothetical protein
VGSGKGCSGPIGSAQPLSNDLEADVQSAKSSRHLFRSFPTERTSLARVGSNRKSECAPFSGFRLSFHLGGRAHGTPDPGMTVSVADCWNCVLNRTVLVRSRCHHRCWMKKRAKKKLGGAILDSVKKEMAKPRLAMSAREGEINSAAGRIVPVKRGRAKPHLLPLPLPRRRTVNE